MIFTSFFILAAAPVGIELNTAEEPDPPPGFFLTDSSIGWHLYRKDYQKGNPDFVQVIDLDQGASVVLLHGEIAKSGEDRGGYGGDNPKFLSCPLSEFWWDSSRNNLTVCVTNGSFFYLPEHPTKLAFPLKVDGEILTDGFGIEQYPWNKRILEIWDDKADIRRLSRWNLHTSTAPNIIAGLSEEANKKKKNFTGRTFIGIDDLDNDGDYETILVYNTMTARQIDAAEVLRSFGADKVMMLDGGGSTQLTCKGESIVESVRLIPQALGINRGEGPLFSGAMLNQNEYPIIVEGEEVTFEINLLNTGANSWRPGETYLLVDNSPWGKNQFIPFERRVLPGERARVNWKINPSSKKGANTSTVYLFRENQKFPLEFGSLSVIVLPRKLKSKLVELGKIIANWGLDDPEQVTSLSNQWIQNQTADSSSSELALNTETKSDGFLTSLLIIPSTIMLLSGVIFVRIQKKNK